MHNQRHIETLLAQLGGEIDPATGGVVPPIQASTTYARGRDYRPAAEGFLYGRDDSNVVRIAESVLASLEGAAASLLFPSGMAAIAALMRTVPNAGAIVLQSQIYWGATKWIRDFCTRRAIGLHEVDASNADLLAAAIARVRPGIVFVETPSNPWLKTVDIAAAAAAAHRVGAILAVDATAATPVLTRPLEFGADISVHAATKAINGHSDVLAGVLSVRDAGSPVWSAIRADRHDAGAVIGPFEAWLLLRGMRTLALRVERACANADAVARFLADHARVREVWYPGLASHPGHALAARQMRGGFGSLLSFLVDGGANEALKVCGRMDVFKRATSLGGVESLAEHRHTIEGAMTGVPENLVRLSVGIENVADLIADLDRALA
jgi:cystathionine gamma-synthase